MSEFRFILDGEILREEPDGLGDFTEAIVRDEELHGMTLEYEGEFVFRGDGYVKLRDLWLDDQCSRITFDVELKCGNGSFEQVAEMSIIVTDVDEDLYKCSATVSPIDNSYYALIHNNRSLKVDMRSEKTKNGVDMEPCPSIPLRFFLPEIATGGGAFVPEAPDDLLLGVYLDNGQVIGGAPVYAWVGATDQIPGDGPIVPGFFRTVLSPSPFSAIWTLAWYDDNGDLQTISSLGFNIDPTLPWDADWDTATTGLTVEESGYVQYQEPEKDRTAYDIREVLPHVLTYITDGQITEVQSEYLDSFVWEDKPQNPTRVIANVNPEEMSYALLSGAEIRKHTGEFLRVDFESLVQTFFGTHNLFWVIQDNVFRIEPFSFWFQAREMELVNLAGLNRSIDSSKLYSQIIAGSAKSIKDRDLEYSLPLFDLTRHADQEYTVGGNCNTDARLNLVAKLTYDSNIIEHIVLNEIEVEAETADPDETYDDDVIMVQYGLVNEVGFALYDATFIRNDLDPPKGLVYNPDVYNNRIISRHTTHAGISIYEGSESDNFRASAPNPDSSVEFENVLVEPALPTSSSQQSVLNALFPAQFPNGLPILDINTAPCTPDIQIDDTTTPPNFNPSNNWDNTEFWYEAPVAGVYGFEFKMMPRKYSDIVKLISDGSEVAISSAPGNANYLQGINASIEIQMEIIDASGDVANVLPVPWVLGGGTTDFELEAGYSEYNKYFFPLIVGGLNSLEQTATAAIGGAAANIFNGRFYGASDNIPQTSGILPGFSLDIDVEGPNRRAITYLPQGWRMRPRVVLNIPEHYRNQNTDQWRKVSYGIASGSWVRSTYVQTGGGLLPSISSEEHMMIDYFTNRPMTLQRWNQIKEDPSLAIGLSTTDVNLVDTYVSRISRNFQTGACDIKMITSRSRL